MKINKIITSVAVHLVALFNKAEWEILKTKPSVRRELRKLQEHYNNQAQELEAEIIKEKNKKIKELKLQLKESEQKASDCDERPNCGADMRERKETK